MKCLFKSKVTKIRGLPPLGYCSFKSQQEENGEIFGHRMEEAAMARNREGGQCKFNGYRRLNPPPMKETSAQGRQIERMARCTSRPPPELMIYALLGRNLEAGRRIMAQLRV